jgi:hypothetical protein
MKLLILNKRDAALLRELIPRSKDCNPEYVKKLWEIREDEAKAILIRIIEAIECEPVSDEVSQ